MLIIDNIIWLFIPFDVLCSIVNLDFKLDAHDDNGKPLSKVVRQVDFQAHDLEDKWRSKYFRC